MIGSLLFKKNGIGSKQVGGVKKEIKSGIKSSCGRYQRRR